MSFLKNDNKKKKNAISQKKMQPVYFLANRNKEQTRHTVKYEGTQKSHVSEPGKFYGKLIRIFHLMFLRGLAISIS